MDFAIFLFTVLMIQAVHQLHLAFATKFCFYILLLNSSTNICSNGSGTNVGEFATEHVCHFADFLTPTHM
jgi:hypothetical protein